MTMKTPISHLRHAGASGQSENRKGIGRRYFCSPQHTDSALYSIISQMERAAGFAHGDTAQTKLDKLDTLRMGTAGLRLWPIERRNVGGRPSNVSMPPRWRLIYPRRKPILRWRAAGGTWRSRQRLLRGGWPRNGSTSTEAAYNLKSSWFL